MSDWFIHNTANNQQSQISEPEIQNFVCESSSEQIKQIFVWQTGWTDWKSILQVPELMKFRIPKTPQPPPFVIRPTPAPGPIAASESTQVDVKIEPRFVERRKSKRHEIKLRVIIIYKDVAFRTFSKDFSGEGFLLEHAVPASLLEQTVECFISSPDLKTGLKFKAKLVQDQEDLRRFLFTQENTKEKQILSSWILSLKKKSAA